MLNDWAYACVQGIKDDGAAVIRARSDGHEARQFLHTNDAAAGLVALLREWDAPYVALPRTVDLTSGAWTTARAGNGAACDETASRKVSRFVANPVRIAGLRGPAPSSSSRCARAKL